MARTHRFVFNQKDIGLYLLSGDVNEGLTSVARKAQGLAESLAPRGGTGEYARSFFLVSVRSGLVRAGNLRTAVLLANDSKKALAIEYGTGSRKQGGSAGTPQRVLGRTAAALTSPRPKGRG